MTNGDEYGPHDPALCPRPVCSECDAYGDGYARGKAKALEEVLDAQHNAHADECRCDPCRVYLDLIAPEVLDRASAALAHVGLTAGALAEALCQRRSGGE